MKLHLPKLLTVALIAAFAAVGSTAFAADDTEFTTTNLAESGTTKNYNAKGFVVVLNGPRLTTTPTFTGNLVYLDSLTLGSLRTVPTDGVTLALADANGNVLSLSENIVSTANQEVTWTFSNTTVATDSSLYFYWLDASKEITVGTKLADSDLASWTNAGNGNNGVSDYNSIAAVASDNSSCGYLDSLSHIQTSNIRYAPKLSIVTSGPVSQDEYTWKATGATALWDEVATNWTLKGEESSYKSSATNIVDFNAGEFAKNVTVSGSISAATVNVNDDYQFTVESGSSLTIDKLSVAAEKTVSVAGAGSVTLSKVTLADEAAINVGTATNMAVTADGDATINATAATTITSLTGPAAGKTLNLGGSNVLTITSANEFAGNVNVTGGTVKLGGKTALGSYNTTGTKTITIGKGATVDINGNGDAKYVYTLNGGTLTNMGNAVGHNMAQTSGLVLAADSYIGSENSKDMWVLAASYGANTVDLAGHKLTKQGNATFGFSNSTITAGTLQVDAGTVQFSDGGSIAANVVLNGGVITGTLTPSANIDITAKESTTISNLTFSIAADKTVTLKTDAEKAISFSGDLGLATGELDVQGAVNVSSNIDLSKSGVSTAKLSLKDGSVTTAAGMWMSSGASLLMEDGAVLNIAGLQIEGTADGGISTTAANEQYGTGKAVFTISNATVTATKAVTIGNTLSNVDVVTGANEVTLNSSANSVTVSDGGTFTKGASATVGAITVEGEGTIASGVEMSDVTLEAGAIATFNEETSIGSFEDSVFVYNVDQTPLKIENVGDKAAKYEDLHQEGMKVYADTLYSGANGVTVANTVAVEAIQHSGEGSLTLAHVDADPLNAIEVTDGSLILQDVAAATISSMEIAAGSSVAVYTDGTQGTEGTVTITETLAAGSATLLANLTIEDTNLQDTVLPLLDVNGGGANALTLGSQFGIVEGTIVSLDAVTMAAIEGMKEGENLDLIKAGQVQLSYLNPGYDGMDYGQLFQRTEGMLGNYVVYANGDAFGVTKQGAVPEPTTGTLSLLALMALAARRRRK